MEVSKKIAKKRQKRSELWSKNHIITGLEGIKEVQLFDKNGKAKEVGKATKMYKIKFNYKVNNGKE